MRFESRGRTSQNNNWQKMLGASDSWDNEARREASVSSYSPAVAPRREYAKRWDVLTGVNEMTFEGVRKGGHSVLPIRESSRQSRPPLVLVRIAAREAPYSS